MGEALQASARAFDLWRKEVPFDRQKILEKAARILEDRFETIAANLTKEMGKPLPEARLELQMGIEIIRWYGEEAKRIYGRIITGRSSAFHLGVRRDPDRPSDLICGVEFPRRKCDAQGRRGDSFGLFHHHKAK